MGGFNGSDPSPPVSQFQRLVVAGKIHYFIVAGSNDDRDNENANVHPNNSGLIQRWVERNFTPTQVGAVTLYDLTD